LLRAGYIVLCDRYIFTAFARDTVRGCPPKWVRGIYNFAALPDLRLWKERDEKELRFFPVPGCIGSVFDPGDSPDKNRFKRCSRGTLDNKDCSPW